MNSSQLRTALPVRGEPIACRAGLAQFPPTRYYWKTSSHCSPEPRGDVRYPRWVPRRLAVPTTAMTGLRSTIRYSADVMEPVTTPTTGETPSTNGMLLRAFASSLPTLCFHQRHISSL